MPEQLVSKRELKRLMGALARAKPDATEEDAVRLADAYGLAKIEWGMFQLVIAGSLNCWVDPSTNQPMFSDGQATTTKGL